MTRMRRGDFGRWVISTAAIAAFLHAGEVSAADPDRVEWSRDWPRVRLVEGANIVALTAASYLIDAAWQPTGRATVAASSGGFDDWVRGAFRGRTTAAQATAADISDYLYRGSVFAPYLIDVWVVALGIHQSVDVALQMALINLQSLGLSGVLALSAERVVGRARPYVQDCGPGGAALDAAGNGLYNHCGSAGDYQSFYSGHSAATATMAGLTCVHHQHLPLYGGGLADLAPCLFMIGASATTGVARVVADRHWATDVLLGWGFGAASGYVLPSLLHYGFTKGRPVGELRVAGLYMVPVPQTYPSGAGLGVAGFF
jgi:membrane-associated phospholipid phosphatase